MGAPVRPAAEAVASTPASRRRSTRSIARALAKDPEERYPSAGDLGRAALGGRRQPAPEPNASGSWPRAPPRRSNRRPSRAARTPPPKRRHTQPQPEAETVHQERSNPGTKRRNALLGAALRRRGRRRRRRGGRARPRRRRRSAAGDPDSPPRTPRATAHRPGAELQVVERAHASASARTSSASSATTSSSAPSAATACGSSRPRPARSAVLRAARSASASTTARSASARSGSRSRATNQLVRLDAKHRPAVGNPIKLPVPPGAVAATKNADLGRARPRQRRCPTSSLKIDPKTGRDARERRLPVRDHVADDEPDRALGRGPPARPRPARRPRDRARSIKTIRVGQQPQRGHRLPRRRAVGSPRPRTTPSTRSRPRPAT